MDCGSPLLAVAMPRALGPARRPALAGDVLPSLERMAIRQCWAPERRRGVIYLPGFQPQEQNLPGCSRSWARPEATVAGWRLQVCSQSR